MAQWRMCKDKAPDALLLFRLGDFYEAFYDDAVVCAQLLNLTLTKRQNIPMSGVPFHAADSYIDKLVSQGHKVAIAEQVEDPRAAKGLLKREITRIITPGTLIQSSLLSDKANNYFAAITQVGKQIGLAFVDLSCADLRAIEVETCEDALGELYRFKPSEILASQKMQEKHPELFTELKQSLKCLIDPIEEWRFDHDLAYGFLTRTLHVHSLDGFGLKGMTAAINAAGALIGYVQDTLYQSLGPIQAIFPIAKTPLWASIRLACAIWN